MTGRLSRKVIAFAITAVLLGTVPVAAQITTGTVAGTVKDAQGGVVPGATIVLMGAFLFFVATAGAAVAKRTA